MDSQIGKIIKSYELEGLVGTGGFGAVYRARQASVAREVAIKIIWPAFANHPNFIRRFEAEAQLVAGLEHPHIVPLYDYWRDPEGAYIVMRFLRGGHLRNMMDGRQWTVKDTSHVLENVASALAMAHRYGVVHRDIKPENILLDEDGNAYLADFGIAQILSNARDEDEFAGMGSPAYAAPEQMLGAGIVSSQSDIYSMGIILFEMLTGQHPFPELAELTMSQLITMRATSPMPPLISRRLDLPSGLNDVLQKATSLDPKMRYPDALSLSYAFREASGQSLISVAGNGKKTMATSATNEAIPNPYKGLRSFQESDAGLFFGRESLVRRLVTRMWENEQYHRFLAVVGPSGSGKSSVVKAGLMPALRQGALPNSQNWYYADFVPGPQPFQELVNVIESVATKPPTNLLERLKNDEYAFDQTLHEVLPDDGSEMVLLIDQFEEIFTLTTSEADTTAFITALYHAVVNPNSRLRLVVTIRADFYDRPLLQPRISDLVRERTEVVVPMTTSELERVIVEPSRKVGVEIDPGLVGAIIADVQAQSGALPLLQYALSELFERREGALITPQAYRSLGGVRGALARRADEIYSKLDAAHQIAVRQLFLRLITLGEGTEDTRRRTLLSEVTALRETTDAKDDVVIMQTVVDTLGRARLLTFDRDPITRTPTVEVTHEAIIREWYRLREWLDESRNDVRLQRTLSQLAGEWYNANRDPSFLMRGIRLQQYERWKQNSTVALTEQERVFLDTSIAERLKAEESESARQQRERDLEQRSIRFLRLIVAGLVVLVVGAVVLTGFALTESQRAEMAAQAARESADISQSIALASSAQNALLNHDGDLAVVLALQANTIPQPPVDSRSTLAQVALARGTRQLMKGHEAGVAGVAISSDAQLIASASRDASVRLWNASDGSLRFKLTGHGGDVDSVAFSPDNKWLVSGGSDFVAIAWDTTTGEAVKKFIGHTAPIRSVFFSPDGSIIYTAANDNLVIAWDFASGVEKFRFTAHTASIGVATISQDGKYVLSGSNDGKLLYWDASNGNLLLELIGHNSALSGVDISDDGKFAVSSSGDGSVIIWNLETGTEQSRLFVTGDEQRSVVFSSDNKFVFAGTLAGALDVWSVETGLLVDILTGHRDAVNTIAISMDGRFAVTGSLDTTVRLWNISNPGELRTLAAHTERVSEMTRGMQTGNIYTASPDGKLNVWSPAYELLNTITLTDVSILALAVSNDEKTAIVGSRDGAVYYVDLLTNTVIAQLTGHTDNVLSAKITPDGNYAITSSQNGELIAWDLTTRSVQGRYTVADDGAINSVAVFPDNKRFVASLGDNTLALYDIDKTTPTRTFTGHTGTIYALDVNLDGSLIVSGGRDGFAIVWDVSTGQERGRLASGNEAVWSVSFNKLGNQVATGTAEGNITLWDVAGSDVLQRYIAGNTVFGLTFAEDGTSLYSGQETGDVVQWLVFSDRDAFAWARNNRYLRDLDCFERERYRIEPYCTTDVQ